MNMKCIRLPPKSHFITEHNRMFVIARCPSADVPLLCCRRCSDPFFEYTWAIYEKFATFIFATDPSRVTCARYNYKSFCVRTHFAKYGWKRFRTEIRRGGFGYPPNKKGERNLANPRATLPLNHANEATNESMIFILQQIYAFERLSMALLAAIVEQHRRGPKIKLFSALQLCSSFPFPPYWWLFYCFMCH